MNLVPTPTTKNAPRTRTPRTEGHVGFFSKSVLWLLTTNIQKKGYFSIVGGAILTSHIWGPHSIALEIHEDELSPIFRKKEKWRRHRAKNESGTSQGVSIFVKPTNTILKKTGRESLPLAIQQVALHSEFHGKRIFDIYSWFSAQWSILSWLWPDFVTRFGWPSVTCLILVQMPHFFSRLYPVPLALVITTGVVLVFNSAWFSSYKPKSKWTNFLARTVEYRVITISGIGYWLLLVP